MSNTHNGVRSTSTLTIHPDAKLAKMLKERAKASGQDIQQVAEFGLISGLRHIARAITAADEPDDNRPYWLNTALPPVDKDGAITMNVPIRLHASTWGTLSAIAMRYGKSPAEVIDALVDSDALTDWDGSDTPHGRGPTCGGNHPFAKE